MKVLTLLIDNYDSYTYNIYQMLAEVNGIAPIVIRNDAYQGKWSVAWADFQHHAATLRSQLAAVDIKLAVNIVISPGPGHPSIVKDFGLCADAIRMSNNDVPVLGVCLGLQGLAAVYGGDVIHAPEVMHGRMSDVYIDALQSSLWAFIPNGFEVVRYHSLVVDPITLPPSLVVTARTDDGVIMAMQHITKPQYGVQFHPEAICTTFGYQLFQNFRDITTQCRPTVCPLHHSDHAAVASIAGSPVSADIVKQPLHEAKDVASPYEVRIDRVNTGGVASIAFARSVFDAIYRSARRSFWLDSSNYMDETSTSRFSYMGDNRGPLSYCVEYSVAMQQLQIHRHQSDGETCEIVSNTDLLTHIRDTMTQFQSLQLVSTTSDIPFSFRGGFVGFLGYEALDKTPVEVPPVLDEAVPDASFLFADRTLVFDHQEGSIYMVCVSSHEDQSCSVQWHTTIKDRLVELAKAVPTHSSVLPQPLYKPTNQTGLVFHPSRSRQQYHTDIQTIQEHIIAGDTYEVCLTNQLYVDRVHLHDPFAFYTELRTRNPAPFAAFYLSNPNHQFSTTTPSTTRSLPQGQAPGLATCEVQEPCSNPSVQRSYAVCCSSPERFLSIDSHGWMESKPIKGTRRRGRTSSKDVAIMEELATCAKDRAENMMIVDLVRHDFGQVAEIASVHVPMLMAVESYATVHQLVTTVRAKKQTGMDVCDVLWATFPGGSMTGAPKKRTMAILRELETHTKRGVYSGAMGFLSLNGSCDLNIVIRTAVITPTSISIGSGGAIVALSDTDDEYDEMLLKTHALVNALSQFLTGNNGKVAVE